MDETIYVILKLLFDFALEVWFSIYFVVDDVDRRQREMADRKQMVVYTTSSPQISGDLMI